MTHVDGPRVDAQTVARIDAMIREIDLAVGSQLNLILGHPSVVALERAWRTLDWLVTRTGGTNVHIEILDASWAALRDEWLAGDALSSTQLARVVRGAREGGVPYAALVALDALDEIGDDDAALELVGRCARIAWRDHAFVIAGVSREAVVRLSASPAYAAWRARDHAPALVLAVGRFAVRGRHSRVLQDMGYAEGFTPEGFTRLPSAPMSCVVAARIADAFVRDGWCLKLLERTVTLPSQVYDLLPRSDADWVVARGFLPVVVEGDGAQLVAGMTTSAPPAEIADPRARFGAELPLALVAARFAHHLVTHHAVADLAGQSRRSVERELDQWIRTLVADGDVVAPVVRARRPLRRASFYVHGGPSGSPERRFTVMLWLHERRDREFIPLSVSGVLLQDPRA